MTKQERAKELLSMHTPEEVVQILKDDGINISWMEVKGIAKKMPVKAETNPAPQKEAKTENTVPKEKTTIDIAIEDVNVIFVNLNKKLEEICILHSDAKKPFSRYANLKKQLGQMQRRVFGK